MSANQYKNSGSWCSGPAFSCPSASPYLGATPPIDIPILRDASQASVAAACGCCDSPEGGGCCGTGGPSEGPGGGWPGGGIGPGGDRKTNGFISDDLARALHGS